MANPYKCNLFEIFEARRAHCRNLLDLARQQKALIDADDYARLLEILGRKQRVLNELAAINERHPDLREQWQARRGRLEPGLRDDGEHILAETEAIMSELLDEESQSTRHLTAKRDRTQKQLQAVSSGGRVNEAYRTSLAPATHRHLDVDQ